MPEEYVGIDSNQIAEKVRSIIVSNMNQVKG
jgi:hypothetical protein